MQRINRDLGRPPNQAFQGTRKGFEKFVWLLRSQGVTSINEHVRLQVPFSDDVQCACLSAQSCVLALVALPLGAPQRSPLLQVLVTNTDMPQKHQSSRTITNPYKQMAPHRNCMLQKRHIHKEVS
jgi:hypothetical protein